MTLTVIGAGLAGCEAAWQAANAGVSVTLVEQKPAHYSPAHESPLFAELVCSNSLKGMRLETAAGLLKEEMKRLGSITVETALSCAVPAGGALAVDREKFASLVTEKIKAHPRITIRSQRAANIPDDGVCIIATGPLTDGELAEEISRLCGERLSFFDASAPIVEFDSVDMERAYFASRYGRGDADYINCPMEKDEFLAFHDALVHAERAPLHTFDKDNPKVYEGCMPIEIMAGRGADTIRYGPLKPIGLRDPRTDKGAYAVVQLRKDNSEGSLYNLVGFQTNLKFGEQKRVFSMIPALHNANFVRYGVMHRNTFIDSPRLLTQGFNLRSRPDLFFAGQITGVEGYMESAASGMLAGINAVRRLKGEQPFVLPVETMMGALSRYISDESVADFQPMGANYGILPPLPTRIRDKKERYGKLAQRALEALDSTQAHTFIYSVAPKR